MDSGAEPPELWSCLIGGLLRDASCPGSGHLEGPREFTAPPAVEKDPLAQRPPCPSQVRFRYSPALNFGYNFSSQSHMDCIFHLMGFLVNRSLQSQPTNRQQLQGVPGPFHRPHPWSPHTGEAQVFTRKGESVLSFQRQWKG